MNLYKTPTQGPFPLKGLVFEPVMYYIIDIFDKDDISIYIAQISYKGTMPTWSEKDRSVI